jgi:hypothetical protein
VNEKIVAPAAATLACVLFLLALAAQHDPFSPQSLANQHFAATPSYATALTELNRVWPPLYPTVLWGITGLGVPLGQVNGLLFAIRTAAAGSSTTRMRGNPPGTLRMRRHWT